MSLISPIADRRRARFVLLTLLGLSATPSPGENQARAQAATAAPAGVPETLNFANGLFRDRRYKLAADEYERFLKDEPAGPNANAARFGLANARLFEGQYADARRQFQAFLKAAPNDPNERTALYRVGETSYLLGDLPAAREALEAFTAKAAGHKNLETAWPYLGEVCFKLRDLHRAQEAYEQGLTLYPAGRLADRARYGLARTLALREKTDDALKVLQELANRGGEWTDRAWLQTGQLEAARGRFAEAVTAFETLERVTPQSSLVAEGRLGKAEALIHLGKQGDAEPILRSLIADSPQSLAGPAALALGSSQLEQGSAADALATLDSALTRFPKAPATVALWFRSAEAELKLEHPDLARERFLKAAAADPSDPWADDAVLRAARIALDAKDYAGARSIVESFATQFPESPLRADAHLVEARIAIIQEKPKDAITTLVTSLANDKPTPATAEAMRYYLGLAYRADGQPAKADEILGMLAKAPSTTASTNAQYLVGQGHFEAKRYAEAASALKGYLAGKPDGEIASNALTYLVWSYLELGEAVDAAREFHELQRRFPKATAIPSTRVRLAWALLEKGDPGEAANEFAAILDDAANGKFAPEAAYGLGKAKETQKLPDEALKAFARAEELDPTSEPAALAAVARARLLADTKHHAESASVYQQYLTAHPDPSKAPKGAEVDVLLSEWGWTLLDADKGEEADAVFARLLKEFPASPHVGDARVNLAASAYQARKYEDVLTLLAPIVAQGSIAPRALIPAALLQAARAHEKRKEWTDAATVLDRLLSEFLDDRYRREARFLRAEVALQAGDLDAADKGFSTLATEPVSESDPERFGAAVRAGRIRTLVALKRWPTVLEAAGAFKAYAPQDPLTGEVDFARGRALQSLAQFSDARDAYRAVIDARKGGDLAARAQLMIGETYFHQKNYVDAKREFYRTVTVYEAPAWQAAALLEIGKVQERLDQWADAAETYKELRSRFSNEPSAAEAKTRLDAALEHMRRSASVAAP